MNPFWGKTKISDSTCTCTNFASVQYLNKDFGLDWHGFQSENIKRWHGPNMANTCKTSQSPHGRDYVCRGLLPPICLIFITWASKYGKAFNYEHILKGHVLQWDCTMCWKYVYHFRFNNEYNCSSCQHRNLVWSRFSIMAGSWII